MRTMSNYLIIIFSVMLFIFRLIVAFTTALSIDFIVQSTSIQYEIIYIMIMLLSIILISKNKLTGAIIFGVSSIIYYGPSLLRQLSFVSSNAISMDTAIQLLTSIVGVIIPIFAFFIIAFAKEQEKRPVHKKQISFIKQMHMIESMMIEQIKIIIEQCR